MVVEADDNDMIYILYIEREYVCMYMFVLGEAGDGWRISRNLY